MEKSAEISAFETGGAAPSDGGCKQLRQQICILIYRMKGRKGENRPTWVARTKCLSSCSRSLETSLSNPSSSRDPCDRMVHSLPFCFKSLSIRKSEQYSICGCKTLPDIQSDKEDFKGFFRDFLGILGVFGGFFGIFGGIFWTFRDFFGFKTLQDIWSDSVDFKRYFRDFLGIF